MQIRMVLDSCPRRDSGWEKPRNIDLPEICKYDAAILSGSFSRCTGAQAVPALSRYVANSTGARPAYFTLHPDSLLRQFWHPRLGALTCKQFQALVLP